jgi:cell division protein FtsX
LSILLVIFSHFCLIFSSIESAAASYQKQHHTSISITPEISHHQHQIAPAPALNSISSSTKSHQQQYRICSSSSIDYHQQQY